MINLEMDSFVLNQQSNRGITDDAREKQGGDRVDTVSPSYSDVSSGVSSEESDMFEEEVNSSSDSSTSSSGQRASKISGPLQDMSSLIQELPFKRGLSKHYNGKSQSFASLANARSLEDLAKPENPYNKKLKSCKSYGGLMESHGSSTQPAAKSNYSRLISKKGSKVGSCSSLCVKRNSSFVANRPPIPPPPHRSTSTTSFTSQPTLFALGV